MPVVSSSIAPISSPEPTFVPDTDRNVVVDRDGQDQGQTPVDPLDLNNVGSGAVSATAA